MNPNGTESAYVNNGTAGPAQGMRIRRRNTMAHAAQITGFTAALLAVMCTIFPAIIAGALAIIFAILSKTGKVFERSAKIGIYLGITAIVINIGIIAYSYIIFEKDPQTHEQVNIMFEQIYGQSYDNMMEDMKDGKLDLEYNYDF